MNLLEDPAAIAFTLAYLETLGKRLSVIAAEKTAQLLKAKESTSKNQRLINCPYFLDKAYPNAKKLNNGELPYADCIEFITQDGRTTPNRLKIKFNSTEFTRDIGNSLWQSIAAEGFTELKKSGKLTANEKGIRIESLSMEKDRPQITGTIQIQPAYYIDQAFSNLILDYTTRELSATETTKHTPEISLRQILKLEYKDELPPYTDNRLANTIGVACMIYFLHEGRIIPYIVRRNLRNVAAQLKGWHCSASGFAKWPHETSLGFDIFRENMYREIREEIGLSKDDIPELIPITLCRELERGGKPQFFFCGITSLNLDQIRQKRLEAIVRAGAEAEIVKDRLLNHGDLVTSPSNDELNDMSSECRTLLHLGIRYWKQREAA